MYGGENVSADMIQQSLLDEEKRLNNAETDKHTRQKAFRVAFDFLENHLPIMNAEDYWLRVCNDVSIVSAENIDNTLCQELLSAILIYMSNEGK